MRKSKKLIVSGAIISALSIMLGIGGVIWNVRASFTTSGENASSGIGSIGGDIEKAIIFSLVSIVGCLFGGLVLAIGAISYRKGK